MYGFIFLVPPPQKKKNLHFKINKNFFSLGGVIMGKMFKRGRDVIYNQNNSAPLPHSKTSHEKYHIIPKQDISEEKKKH